MLVIAVEVVVFVHGGAPISFRTLRLRLPQPHARPFAVSSTKITPEASKAPRIAARLFGDGIRRPFSKSRIVLSLRFDRAPTSACDQSNRPRAARDCAAVKFMKTVYHTRKALTRAFLTITVCCKRFSWSNPNAQHHRADKRPSLAYRSPHRARGASPPLAAYSSPRAPPRPKTDKPPPHPNLSRGRRGAVRPDRPRRRLELGPTGARWGGRRRRVKPPSATPSTPSHSPRRRSWKCNRRPSPGCERWQRC